jgi:hypothetical protein
MWRYGAGLFIEEPAGAINRINYNQQNEQLNALAGKTCCRSKDLSSPCDEG